MSTSITLADSFTPFSAATAALIQWPTAHLHAHSGLVPPAWHRAFPRLPGAAVAALQFPRFDYDPRNLLEAQKLVTTLVGMFSSLLLRVLVGISTGQLHPGLGADIVMESIALIEWFRVQVMRVSAERAKE